MKRFNIIKKSRKNSEDLDEKIEYLNKECQKTGLQEVMTTSNIYVGTEQIPNTTYTDVESISIGGYAIGLSGAKGSVGGASIGSPSHSNQTGVALSPPHPVTGARRSAYHITTGLGDSVLLRPGQITYRGFSNNPPSYTMGGALWFFDPTYNSGEGHWYNLEWGNFPNKTGWGFWDTVKTGQFTGLYFFNTDTSQHPSGGGSLGTEINDKISGINFGINGEVGTPTTTIFIKNDLGDPNFLPINIDGISSQAFDYLRNKAGTNVASSLSGGGYGGYYDVGGGDYRGIDQILRMYNDPDKDKKYPDRMLKNIDQLMIDLDLVQNDSRFSDPVSDIEIPGLGAKPGDQLAFLPFGGGNNNKPFDPTKKQNRRDTINLINAVNSGDPLFLPPGVTMDQAREFVRNRDNGNLTEKFKLRNLKPELKNEDVIDNTKFNVIKKSRKKSKGIDEKIEYLNKECQKTGLHEIANSTTGLYQGSSTNPNEKYVEFTAKNCNGYPFGISGDSNLGQQSIGGAMIRADGAALSPPHPITGERTVAYTKGSYGMKIAVPGQQLTPQSRMTGPVLWWFDSAYNFAGQQGRWMSMEYNSPAVHGNGVYPGARSAWGYWGTGFLGFALLRDDESYQHVFDCLNDSNGDQFNPDEITVPTTTVLFQNELGDPNHLPIDVGKFGLSPEAFEWLKDKATDIYDAAQDFGDKLDRGIEDVIDKIANNVEDLIDIGTDFITDIVDVNDDGEVSVSDIGETINDALDVLTGKAQIDFFNSVTAPIWDSLPGKPMDWMEDRMQDVNFLLLSGINDIQEIFTGEDVQTAINWMDKYSDESRLTNKYNNGDKQSGEIDMTSYTEQQDLDHLTTEVSSNIGSALEGYKDSIGTSDEENRKDLLKSTIDTFVSMAINNNDALANSMGGMPGTWITDADIDQLLETGNLTIHKGIQSEAAGYKFDQDSVPANDTVDFIAGLADLNPDTVGAGSVPTLIGAMVAGKLGLKTHYDGDSSGSDAQDLQNTPPMSWKVTFPINMNVNENLSIFKKQILIEKNTKKKPLPFGGLSVAGFDGNLRPSLSESQKRKQNFLKLVPRNKKHKLKKIKNK